MYQARLIVYKKRFCVSLIAKLDLLFLFSFRSQKAAVEFLWNGAQQSGEPEDSSETITEAILGFSKKEFAYWESNLLWSLKEFIDYNKPLVLWDMITAMLAFKESVPEFVELVITKWLSVSYLGFHADIPMEDLVPKISKRFSAVPSRLLHILNVISRRVMLSELKTEEINRKLQGQGTNNNEEEISLLLKLLEGSERELRERLVGLSKLVTHSLKVKSCLTRSSNSTETALEEKAFCQSSDRNKKKERCVIKDTSKYVHQLLYGSANAAID